MPEEQRTTQREPKQRAALMRRLRTVEGQIRGIQGMVENDAYCDDILNQVAAARAALTGISKLLLESHLHSCVKRRLSEGDEEILDELMTSIDRLL